MLLNATTISPDTLITIIFSVGSSVVVFIVMYFTQLMKLKEDIAEIKAKLLDKEKTIERITSVEGKVENQKKVLDFVEDKIIHEVMAKKDKK